MADIFSLMINKLYKGPDKLQTEKVIDKLINQHEIGNSDSFLYFLNKVMKNNTPDPGPLKGDDLKVLSDILGDISRESLKMLLTDRAARYVEYEAIIRQITYAKRALKVITSEIVSPNNMDTQMLNIRENTHSMASGDRVKETTRNVQQIIRDLDLAPLIKQTVHMSCKYGDSFVEIIDMDQELVRKGILQESLSFEGLEEALLGKKEGEEIEVSAKKVFKPVTITIYQNEPVISDSKQKHLQEAEDASALLGEDKEEEDELAKRKRQKSKLQNLLIMKHNPGVVVRLGEQACFGYLVFPKELGNAPPMDFNIIYAATENEKLKDFLKKFKMQLAKQVNLKKDLEFNRDLKVILTKLYLFYNDEKTKSSAMAPEVRYVPPENIVHFKLHSDVFDPYGESIFHNLEFDAKLVILFKISMTIMRLSRSSEKRVIAMEVGIDKNARNAMEKIKEHYERRKYSISDTGGIDSVPSLITTFENIYVPMKDGKRFVEFDTLGNPGDLGQSVEDWKAMRDSFVAGMDVPPAYLGLEENVESRALLSHENLIFAKSIIDYQTSLEPSVNNLISSIHFLVFGTYCDDIWLSFPRPRTIELAQDSEYLEALDRFFELVKKLKLSQDKYKRKYIDSDLIEKSEKDFEEDIDAGQEGEMGGAGGMPPAGGGAF